jgi:HemY protein
MMMWFKGARLFLKLSLAIIFSVFLSLNPGVASLKWFGYQIEMPVAILLVGVFILIVLILSLHSLWQKLWLIPEYYIKFMQKRRQLKGEKLLIEGLTAIAAEQAEEAIHSIELAKVLIPDNPLTLFVAAQSAHMNQDTNKARSYFESMHKQPNLRFLGLRGLILQAKEKKDWVQVENFLKEALKLRPDAPWIHEQILENQVRLIEANQMKFIETQSVQRFLPSNKWSAHQAVMYWLRAEQVQDDLDQHITLLSKAHTLSPDSVPIACYLATAYHRAQNSSKAQKVLNNTYKAQPHRELTACWLKINSTLKSLEAYQGLEKLTASHPNHPETLWIMAQAAFEAQLWGQAQKLLQDLHAEYGDTQGICYMMAQLEEIQHPQNKDLIRSWWRRAMAAGPENHWLCQNCGHHSHKWEAICDYCGAINKSQWQGFQKNEKTESILLLS